MEFVLFASALVLTLLAFAAVSGRLVGLYAHALNRASSVLVHLAWALGRQPAAMPRLAERVFDLSDRVDRHLFASHKRARALGAICEPCAERLPGWWDETVDCGGHRCGDCAECQLAGVTR